MEKEKEKRESEFRGADLFFDTAHQGLFDAEKFLRHRIAIEIGLAAEVLERGAVLIAPQEQVPVGVRKVSSGR